MNADNDFGKLLERYFLGTISAQEMECLDACLQTDAARRDEFAAMARLDTNLREAALQQNIESTTEPTFRSRIPRNPQLIGLAAAALIIASIIVLLWPKGSGLTQIAHITELGGSLRWTGDGGRVSDTLTRGQGLHGGTLESLSPDSWIEITYTNGSKLSLSGRSSVTISQQEKRNIVHLREGNLSAEVAPTRNGDSMQIRTPTAQAEVLGTRFTVMVDSSSTRVTVYEGQLRVTRLADGSKQDVSSDHFIVSTLDTLENFVMLPRERSVDTWKSSLPGGVHHGDWIAGQPNDPGRLRAKPLLWKEYGEQMVLYLAALSATGEGRPTAILMEGAHVRVVGRVKDESEVFFGLTTHRVGGEFGGKYITSRKLRGSTELIEIDLPINEFNRQYFCFPESLIGHELVDWWALTINQEAGLEIISVELLAPSMSP